METNVLDFVVESVHLIHDKLNPLEGFNFSLSIVDDNLNPDMSRHVRLNGNIYARRFKKSEWRTKIDSLITLGFSSMDVLSILSPENKGTETDYYLVASIIFRLGTTMSGQIDFIREYNGRVLIKEFSICYYRANADIVQKSIEEIAVDWKSGISLFCMSVLDCNRNPKKFLKTRS